MVADVGREGGGVGGAGVAEDGGRLWCVGRGDAAANDDDDADDDDDDDDDDDCLGGGDPP